jgi:hypothetical protein
VVTVIVVNWNGAAMLVDCLASLELQRMRPSRVVVVDNGSSDDSVAVVRKRFPNVDIIALKRNEGFAAANNAALRTVTTPYVALINNDALAHRDWIGCCVEALERYPDAGMAASKMLFADRADTIDRVGDGYSRAGAGILRGRNAPADAFSQGEWIFGACAGAAMYRMDMLKRIGCFDPTFFLLYEDVDLSFRAQLAGYKCRYVPDALVYHRSCATIGRDSAVSVYFGHRNGEWVYFRNMPIGLIQKSFLLHFRYIILSGLYFLSRRLGAVYFQAKKDAFAALPGILQQRAGIQMSRKIKDTDLWELFSPDQPLDRLRSRRIRITS